MTLIKVCPQCQVHNLPTAFECSSCGFDLTAEKAVQEELLQAYSDNNNSTIKEETVKVCPACGTRNLSNARKCSQCGEDLSDQIPEVESAIINEQQFILRSVDGKYSFKLSCGDNTVGREQKMQEYLSNKPYVSRVHCKLMVEEGVLYIENLSSTNSTFVNNIRIAEKTILSVGDEIGLGGNSINGLRQEDAAYFVVEVE